MIAVAAVMAKAKPMAMRNAEEPKISNVRIEHESGAANVGDQRRRPGLIDLAPQIADMHVDDIGFRNKTIVPYFLQQHGAGDDLAGPAKKIFEQLELARQQIDLRAVA